MLLLYHFLRFFVKKHCCFKIFDFYDAIFTQKTAPYEILKRLPYVILSGKIN